MEEKRKYGLFLHEIATTVSAADCSQLNAASASVNAVNEVIFSVFHGEGEPIIAAAYLSHTVLFGRFENNVLTFHKGESFELKHLLRLRVFSEDAELLIYRTSTGFKGRFREDGKGQACTAVDANQIIAGTAAVSMGTAYTLLTEDRGTELLIPYESSRFTVDDEKHRIAIQTRNYTGLNEIGQAGYVDSRFIRFCQIPAANNLSESE